MRDITQIALKKRRRKAKAKTSRPVLVTCICLIILIASVTQIVRVNKHQATHQEVATENIAQVSKLIAQPAPNQQSETQPPLKEPDQSNTQPSAVHSASVLTTWRGQAEPMSIAPNTAPVVQKIPTAQPVVFLTIDDGVTQSAQTLDWLAQHKLPFSLFLYNGAIQKNYAYFRHLQSSGMLIEDHTMSHPQLPKLNLDQQKAEICGAADTYARVFGRRPYLFRPPYGLLNDTTKQAASACGMHAIVMWHATVDGGAVHFQAPSTHLEPGDIVLMHFLPGFQADIQAFTKQANQDHLQVGRLEDWIK